MHTCCVIVNCFSSFFFYVTHHYLFTCNNNNYYFYVHILVVSYNIFKYCVLRYREEILPKTTFSLRKTKNCNLKWFKLKSES